MFRKSNDIHVWNAIELYGRNSHGGFVGDVVEYFNRYDELYGGKVKIFLKPLNKHLNDFDRPLPHSVGVSKKKTFEQFM